MDVVIEASSFTVRAHFGIAPSSCSESWNAASGNSILRRAYNPELSVYDIEYKKDNFTEWVQLGMILPLNPISMELINHFFDS